MRIRMFVGSTIAAAALVTTAGCTSDTKADGAAKSSGPAAAAQKTVEVTPAVAVTKAAKRAAAVNSVKFTMKGTVPGEGTVEGTASMSTRPAGMDMAMKVMVEGAPQQVRMVLVGDGMYINAGKDLAPSFPGKHWMKLDLGAVAKKSGAGNPLADLGSQGRQDPSADSAMLAESKDVKKIGQETVDGVVTTHYAGTINVDDLGKGDAGALDEARRDRTIEQFKALGAKSLTLDMWVGPDDRTVQFRERAATPKGQLDVTIRFQAVNVPVTIKAPAASDTVDFAEVMKQAQTAGA